MNSNLKQDIIIPAWDIIKNDFKVKKFYFLPGVISIIFLTILLVYQSIYAYVEIFDQREKALLLILDFFNSNYLIETIIIAIIFIISYLIIIPIFEGGLIRYIDNKGSENKSSIGDSIGLGIYRFFPLFEFNNLFSELKLISILNGYLFVLRFLGLEYFKYINIIFLIILFFSVIINILIVYSKYEIILGDKKTFPAVSSSSKITILNLKTTLKLYFLMFLFNIRVIINFLVFLIFPIIMVILISYITSDFFLTLTISIVSIIFFLFILFLGYLTAVLDVFKASIWYFAYKKGLENIDKIEGNKK